MFEEILTYIGITVILVNLGIISIILFTDPLIKRLKQFNLIIKHWFVKVLS